MYGENISSKSPSPFTSNTLLSALKTMVLGRVIVCPL
nr:MAG TPA: hypothetical protein [Caudoviricetes sp.]